MLTSTSKLTYTLNNHIKSTDITCFVTHRQTINPSTQQIPQLFSKTADMAICDWCITKVASVMVLFESYFTLITICQLKGVDKQK